MRILVDDSTSRSEERPGFFERQFVLESTRGQDVFDFVFGILGPVLVFYFDPVVFRGGEFGGGPLMGRYQTLAYAISAIQIPVFAVWWLWGRRLRSFSAPIGGILIAGSIVSFVIGVLILPYSIIGMIILIGVFGFTPFVTFFVYLRNGCRALAGQERNGAYSSRFLTAPLAAILSIGLPVFATQLVNQTLTRSTQQIVSGDAKQVELAVNQLRWMPFIPQETRRSIMSAYQGSNNSEQRELLKKAYRELTGEDSDTSIRILND